MPKYKLSIGAIILSILVPTVTHAAYNDVSLTTDTIITVNSINLNVSGATAALESIVLKSDLFTASLAGTSTITVTSNNGYTLTTTAAPSYVSKTCASGVSSITLSIPAGSPNSEVTMDVTPSTTACTVVSNSGGSNAGGGGGVPSTVATTPAIPNPTIVAVTGCPSGVICTLVVTGSASIVLTKDLSRGSEGSDVTILQKFLAQDKAIYPEGVVNGTFGPATERAVKRFQAKHGISQVGRVGPATRAKIAEVSKTEVPATTTTSPTINCPTGLICTPTQGVTTPSPMISAVFLKVLSKGVTSDDVLKLQKILNSDPDTIIAVSGAGSLGNETNLYGSLTEKAVGKFQVKYGIAAPGESGYGTVGPKTRAKLNELAK